MSINKEEYQATVDLSKESTHDWQGLINDSNVFEASSKKKRRKK
jgi:hypothetical protein